MNLSQFLTPTIMLMLGCLTLSAEDQELWSFEDVTETVVDINPPVSGNIFDYAFVDLNDDNYLDIITNNHNTHDDPMWLGTADHKFVFWQNLPKENKAGSAFYLSELDYNGDGKTDLGYTGNEGGFMLNLNDSPAGTYKPVFKGRAKHLSSPLTTFIDLNGDGKLETMMRPGLIFGDLNAEPIQEGIQYGFYAVADFNNDGWPDVFSGGVQTSRAGRAGPRKMFKNNEGKLEEIKVEHEMFASYIGGLPRAADFNNDGNMDLYIWCDHPLVQEKGQKKQARIRLYLGDGNFGFTDISERADLTGSTITPGYSHVYLADINNDGFVDVVNQGNYGTQVWRNNGDETFFAYDRRKHDFWPGHAHMRFDDYDMDGRLDVVTKSEGASYRDREKSIRVFRNTIENDNGWLKVQLRQADANTMAIGALVTLYKAGTKSIVGNKMLMADTVGLHPRLHFGLGTCEKIDIDVLFPSDRKKVSFKDVEANRYIVLRPDGSVKDIQFGKQ